MKDELKREDVEIFDELFFAEFDHRFRIFKTARIVPEKQNDEDFVFKHFFDELMDKWALWFHRQNT